MSNVDKKTADGEQPVRLVNYTDVYYGDRLSPSLDLMEATASTPQIRAFRLRPGDVVITKDSELADDIGIAAYIEASSDNMVLGYHLALLRPRPEIIDGRYLYWAMRSDHVRGQLSTGASGVTRFGLRKDVIASTVVSAPTLGAQRVIADFLHTETARIDALITKKGRMKGLLAEYRQGVAAVALQADGYMALRRVADVLPGCMFSSEDFGAHIDGPRLLRGVNVGVGTLRWDDVVSLRDNRRVPVRYFLRENDVVIGMDRPFIAGGTRVAIVDEASAGSLLVQRVCRVRANSPAHAALIAAVLGTGHFKAHVEADLTGVSVPHLSDEQIGSMRIPAWDASAVEAFASRLLKVGHRTARLIGQLDKQIELLQERRRALITAAVTGELDVPGVAA